MSAFVTSRKQTLDKSPVIIIFLDEINVEANSDLEMSKERNRFKEHLWQFFELERSI